MVNHSFITYQFQVKKFYSMLETQQIPKGDGLRFREEAMIAQIPLQDFHFHEFKFDEKNAESVFKWFNKKRLQDAIGVGKWRNSNSSPCLKWKITIFECNKDVFLF